MTTQTKTLKVRVKDHHAKLLGRMARDVNFVWNYHNDLSHRMIKERGKFLSEFDFNPYTRGASKDLSVGSSTIQAISKQYAQSRSQFKKAKLRWRKSYGVRRSLGWIPILARGTKWKKGGIQFNGTIFKVWDSYGLSQYTFRAASFVEDARGRWYFCVVVETEAIKSAGRDSVGIDLGLKDAVTTSSGDSVSGHWYKATQKKLGEAQRARKKARVRAIHAKIKNKRADALHKFSRKLINENAAIFVGNVSLKASKSRLDAGWALFKTMLKYKCEHAGVVNEAYTTQTCSSCGVIPVSSPKGRAGLGIREWTCGGCGSFHHRDVNAAKNILALGHERLAVGIPAL